MGAGCSGAADFCPKLARSASGEEDRADISSDMSDVGVPESLWSSSQPRLHELPLCESEEEDRADFLSGVKDVGFPGSP